MNYKKVASRILLNSPFRKYYTAGLLPNWRLLLVNFFFQRICGINREVKFSVHYTFRVTNPENLFLGDGVIKSFAISGGCYIQAGNGIYIGSGTIFAPGVKIISANHSLDPSNRDWVKESRIKIGENSWIGANAVILPGCELGDHVVVGAGAVVTKSFGSNSILVGNPAKLIGPSSS
ncbi:MAG TPA: acyltransferase [Bellilinea sp.]|nr:acyltransferase [Bellilinea sp.]